MGPLPVESHRMHVFSPTTGVAIYIKCCVPGKLITDSVPRFSLWSGHIGTYVYHIPNFQTPRRKPHNFHTQFRHSETLLFGLKCENPPEIQVPRC